MSVAVIGAAEAVRLSVAAKCDPRSIKNVARGIPVRGDAGVRARDALLAAGYEGPARKIKEAK